MLCLIESTKDLWDGLVEAEASFLAGVWEALFANDPDPSLTGGTALYFWIEAIVDSRLRVVSPRGWEALYDAEDITRLLPDPGPEWRLDPLSQPPPFRRRRPYGF